MRCKTRQSFLPNGPFMRTFHEKMRYILGRYIAELACSTDIRVETGYRRLTMQFAVDEAKRERSCFRQNGKFPETQPTIRRYDRSRTRKYRIELSLTVYSRTKRNPFQ